MNEKYRIRLASKNEGLEYEDDEGIYRFAVELSKGVWFVQLPPSKGSSYSTHVLTDEERQRLFPRIIKYLSRVWWFGLFPRSYDVRFVE
jgi:hypothetical protein